MTDNYEQGPEAEVTAEPWPDRVVAMKVSPEPSKRRRAAMLDASATVGFVKLVEHVIGSVHLSGGLRQSHVFASRGTKTITTTVTWSDGTLAAPVVTQHVVT